MPGLNRRAAASGLVRLAGALAVLLVVGEAACAQPPLWIARGARGTVYLFGSIHLLPRGLNWMPPALGTALASANEVWFEIPIDEATNKEAGDLAKARGLLPPGVSLFEDLTVAQAATVSKAARTVGLTPASLSPLRPWLADVTLDLAADEKAGAIDGEGVEQQNSGSGSGDGATARF